MKNKKQKDREYALLMSAENALEVAIEKKKCLFEKNYSNGDFSNCYVQNHSEMIACSDTIDRLTKTVMLRVQIWLYDQKEGVKSTQIKITDF